jgi:SAM-dependent methyltransferase
MAEGHRDASGPGTHRSESAWDERWRRVLATDWSRDVYEFLRTYRLGEGHGWVGARYDFAEYRDRGLEHILYAGNGLRVLPAIAAHCGFRAQAVDISGVATEYCESHPVELPCWEFFFWSPALDPEADDLDEEEAEAPDRRAARELMRRSFRRGGRLDCQRADLFDLDLEESSIGAVMALNLLHLYATEERMALARQFHRWLQPGGQLLVEAPADTAGPPEAEQAFAESILQCGFRLRYGAFWQWRRSEECVALEDTESFVSEWDRRYREACCDDLRAAREGARLLEIRRYAGGDPSQWRALGLI